MSLVLFLRTPKTANRLGFEKIIVPKFNMKGIDPKAYGIEIIAVGKIEELYNVLFV